MHDVEEDNDENDGCSAGSGDDHVEVVEGHVANYGVGSILSVGVRRAYMFAAAVIVIVVKDTHVGDILGN